MDPTPAVTQTGTAVPLLLALTGLLGTVVVPIVLALLARGGRARAVQVDERQFIPRAEFDELLERLGDADGENDRLHRQLMGLREDWAAETNRLRDQIHELTVRNTRLETLAEKHAEGGL